MGTIEELFSIRDRWNSASRTEQIILVVIAAIIILTMFFLFIIYADQATSVIEKRNVSEKLVDLSGGILMSISYFDVVLILSVIFLIISLSIIIVYIVSQMNLNVARARDETNAIKSELIKQQDQNTKDILELINLCRRLRDNLYQLNKESQAREAKASITPGMHRTELELEASMVLMEGPSDLIKESDKLFEKYNL